MTIRRSEKRNKNIHNKQKAYLASKILRVRLEWGQMERSSACRTIIVVAVVYLLYTLVINKDESGSGETETMSNDERFISDFEVFGKVQGVFFRKYTKQMARSLGLTGWCQNTVSGTVKGQIEGTESNILKMQEWLRSTGSPQSKISHAEFSAHMRPVTVFMSETFEIRR